MAFGVVWLIHIRVIRKIGSYVKMPENLIEGHVKMRRCQLACVAKYQRYYFRYTLPSSAQSISKAVIIQPL